MNIQATLDHFGYDVVELLDWTDSTWFNITDFNIWFGAIRSSKRMKDIMPLLESATESESEDEGEGRGESGPGSGSGSGDDSPPRPRTPEGSPPPLDNHDPNGPGPSDSTEFRGIPDSTTPDQFIIVDSMSKAVGSFDGLFKPFTSDESLVPINPFAQCKIVKPQDYLSVGMTDPSDEAINKIIAAGARSAYGEEIAKKLTLSETSYEPSDPSGLKRYAISNLLTDLQPSTMKSLPPLRKSMKLRRDYAINHLGWTEPTGPLSFYQRQKSLKKFRVKTKPISESTYPEITIVSKEKAIEAVKALYVHRK